MGTQSCSPLAFPAFFNRITNQSWWFSIPLDNWFSGVVTMWRWKAFSKALNRCCNYLSRLAQVLEHTIVVDAPSVIYHLQRGKGRMHLGTSFILTSNVMHHLTAPWGKRRPLKWIQWTPTIAKLNVIQYHITKSAEACNLIALFDGRLLIWFHTLLDMMDSIRQKPNT